MGFLNPLSYCFAAISSTSILIPNMFLAVGTELAAAWLIRAAQSRSAQNSSEQRLEGETTKVERVFSATTGRRRSRRACRNTAAILPTCCAAPQPPCDAEHSDTSESAVGDQTPTPGL